MKLSLVKQGDFLGTNCDFYVDEENNIYMSRTQIGYALQYKKPQHGILVLHQRHKERFDKFSISVSGSQFETPIYKNSNAKKVFMYLERGIYEICRRSNQLVADEFNDWVFDVIQSIKKNSYYVATEKDNKWLGIRQESKQIRKMETDAIQQFVMYAKEQGSRNAERYYLLFTKLVNGKLNLASGKRDFISQETLMEVKGLETIVQMYVKTLMSQKIPYKQIYQEVKKMIKKL